MNLQKLQSFLKICQHNSFSSAAKELYISQQGISKLISGMEKELGIPLFIRNKKGIQLSPEGKLFQSYAEDIIARDLRFHHELELLCSQKRSCSIAVTSGFLFIAEEKINHVHPEIELIETYDYSCDEYVLNREVPFGISVLPVTHKQLASHPITRYRICVFCSENHPFAEKSELRLSDFENQQIVLFSKRFKINHVFREALVHEHIDYVTICETENMMHLYNRCSSSNMLGIGIAFPNSIYQLYHLKMIPLHEDFFWEPCFITRKDVCFTEDTRILFEKLKKLF